MDVCLSKITVKHNPFILSVQLVIFDKNLNASTGDFFTDGLADIFLNGIQ